MSKTVLVTGATTGTGYCVAKKFASNGYNVVITSREDARAKEAAAKLKAEVGGNIETFGYGLEVLNEPQMIAMFDDLKAKGYMVGAMVLVAANMGINMPNFFEVDYKDWIRVIETNIGWNFMFISIPAGLSTTRICSSSKITSNFPSSAGYSTVSSQKTVTISPHLTGKFVRWGTPFTRMPSPHLSLFIKEADIFSSPRRKDDNLPSLSAIHFSSILSPPIFQQKDPVETDRVFHN